MRLVGECSSSVRNNGVVKMLITMRSYPSSQDEYVLCNLLLSRGEFEQGDMVEITIKKVKR